MELIKVLLFICLYCVCFKNAIAATEPTTAKPLSASLAFSHNLAAFVCINGTKYRLLQRYPDYWVLYDMQLSQAVHLTNQLVVSGNTSEQTLRKYLKNENKITVSEIVADTFLLTGGIAGLMQAEQYLKTVAGLKLEWQIRYLPLKPAADR